MEDLTKFQKELQHLINKHSLENGSNTPDFVLAEYLVQCLVAFNVATSERERLCEPIETNPSGANLK